MKKVENYIHEKELNSLLMDMWEELYYDVMFKENDYDFVLYKKYDEDFLTNCFLELFKYDRENMWIIGTSTIETSIWNKAYDEHLIILKTAGRLLSYIIEPFDFVDALHAKWTEEEMKLFEQEWGI